MKPFPNLVTDRLFLNQIKTTDIPLIVAYAGNIKIIQNTRTMPFPYFEEDAIAWINMANQGFKAKDNYIFAIRSKTDESFMGGIGLTLDVSQNRAELGYWLAEKFWGAGFTTEAVKAILQFGFEQLKLNKIIAVYLTTNVASGKVMIKNNMIKEAELKDHDLKRGSTLEQPEYVSLIQYRILKDEYEKIKNT
ncbi:MAG: GNAT family N-acetyltransferase [Maribacter sp.]|uniref:GNAT family N-acetyltransferase n=1 Tax=Maribacter sp. 2307UL18-2 TaxID=3386274 RepID=UPI0039BD8FBA